MQPKIIATAGARGLSAPRSSPPPLANAAEVGPKQQEDTDPYCELTLTDAEYKAYVDSLGYVSAEEVTEAHFGPYEAVYPGLKELRLEIAADVAALPKLDSNSPDEVSERLRQVNELGNKFVEKAAKFMPRAIAEILAEPILYLGNFKDGENYADLMSGFQTSTLFVESEPIELGNSFTAQDLVNVGVSQKDAQAMVAGFKKAPLIKKADARTKHYAPYYAKAREACAAGGERTVAFPTKATNPAPGTPGNGNQGSAADSDAGKTAGIVVGVIAALAAIAGAIAFLAPQLGIMLPQLPF